jgi:hypothetical protein
MDGNTWTSNHKVAEAINKSQDASGCTITLLAEDGEEFDELVGDLAGCCTEQTLRGSYVVDFAGYEEGSVRWYVQLALRSLHNHSIPRLSHAERNGLRNATGGWSQHVEESHDQLADNLTKACEMLAEYKRQTAHYKSFTQLNAEAEALLETMR